MKNLLVLIPHAGTKIPKEIGKKSINPSVFREITYEEDCFTDKVYDIKKNFSCHQIVFPYSRAFVDLNCHPDDEWSIPVKTWSDENLYIETPSDEFRKMLLKKYHESFHNDLKNYLIKNKEIEFIFDCHSTAIGDDDNYHDKFDADICVSNYQIKYGSEDEFEHTCNDRILEIYYNKLCKMLPGLTINVNSKYLTRTYGHIEGLYGSSDEVKHEYRKPLLLQEINEYLYTDLHKGYDKKRGSELKKIFTECLKHLMKNYF